MVQLQERRRQLRRQRSVDDPLDAARLALAVREQDGAARLKDRRHSHRQRLGRHLLDVSAEERRVAAPRLRPQRDAVGARLEHGARLVEADVAVGADAENLDVDAASLGDRPLVARHSSSGSAVPTRKLIRSRAEVDVAEQVLLHELAVRAGIVRGQADELVEIEGRRLDQSRPRAEVSRASSSYSAIGVRPVARPSTRAGFSWRPRPAAPRRRGLRSGIRARYLGLRTKSS